MANKKLRRAAPAEPAPRPRREVPRVTADPEEPTRCLVDFAFTVAHGLNQIWLSAHITV